MNTEYWFLVAGLLALRAILIPRSSSLAKTAVLMLGSMALLSAFTLRWPLLVLAVSIAAVHLGHLAVEARYESAPSGKPILMAARILSGILLLTIASIAFSPSSPLSFGSGAQAVARFARSYSYFGAKLDSRAAYHLWLYLSAGLYVSFEANFLVALVLHALRIEPVERESEGDNEPTRPRTTDERELNRGRVIGILERLLILAFTVAQSVSSIGFILAAKGFARFRELDNKDFAEYVLVGTLLSASLAVALGLLTRSFTI